MGTANWYRIASVMLLVTQARGMRLPFKDEESADRERPCQTPRLLKSSTNPNQIPSDTMFFIEHEISWEAARTVAEKMSVESNPEDILKCDKCTEDEMNYCLGPGIIDDHCCCDGKHSVELFSFIPHTCYRGKTICKPVQNSCEDYERIRDCCCKPSLAKKWKSKFQNASASVHKTEVVRWIPILFTILTTYLYVID